MGKSSSPPPAPDYTAAAQATAAGNLEAARYATQANRVNQYTPYGSLTYKQGGGSEPYFNEQGYNAALKAYQDQMANYQPGGHWETWGNPDLNDPMAGGRTWVEGTGGPAPVEPNRQDYMLPGGNPDSWSSTISLSPVGQELLNYGNEAALGLGRQIGQGIGRVDETLSQPFDYGSVGSLNDAAYAAQTARLDPEWARRLDAERTRLTNQGLAPGGEAWDAEMRNYEQARNDAYQQARLAAMSMMPQTYQLAAALRSQPLNELNALRTGSQVQNPQFTAVPQQQTTPGPNLLGAANAQYGASLDQYNSQVASNNALMGGLFGLGSAVLGNPYIGAAFFA